MVRITEVVVGLVQNHNQVLIHFVIAHISTKFSINEDKSFLKSIFRMENDNETHLNLGTCYSNWWPVLELNHDGGCITKKNDKKMIIVNRSVSLIVHPMTFTKKLLLILPLRIKIENAIWKETSDFKTFCVIQKSKIIFF